MNLDNLIKENEIRNNNIMSESDKEWVDEIGDIVSMKNYLKEAGVEFDSKFNIIKKTWPTEQPFIYLAEQYTKKLEDDFDLLT